MRFVLPCLLIVAIASTGALVDDDQDDHDDADDREVIRLRADIAALWDTVNKLKSAQSNPSGSCQTQVQVSVHSGAGHGYCHHRRHYNHTTGHVGTGHHHSRHYNHTTGQEGTGHRHHDHDHDDDHDDHYDDHDDQYDDHDDHHDDHDDWDDDHVHRRQVHAQQPPTQRQQRGQQPQGHHQYRGNHDNLLSNDTKNVHIHVHMDVDSDDHCHHKDHDDHDRDDHDDHDDHDHDDHDDHDEATRDVYAVCVFATPTANHRMHRPRGNPRRQPSRSGVQGKINFHQRRGSDDVKATLNLSGFNPSHQHRHGFHIHEFGDMSQACQSLGGHYNPHGSDHRGSRGHDDGHGHVGDLGNIECDRRGQIRTMKMLDDTSLVGPHSIMGRSIVIHDGPDDLGVGRTAASRTSGNAGGRMACCIITHTSVPSTP